MASTTNVNQPSPSTRRTNRVVMMLTFVVVLLLGAAAVLIYLNVRQAREAEYQEQQLINAKDSIAIELRKVLVAYDTIQTSNDRLKDEIETARTKGQQLQREMENVKRMTADKLIEYQKELGTLRAIMRKMVTEIDSLNTLNQQLVAENTKIRTEVAKSQKKVEAQAERIVELEVKEAKAVILATRDIETVGLDKRDKVAKRARRTRKLKTCFTLLANAVADPGPRMIYTQITDPDGILLADPNGATTKLGEEEVLCSAVREVDYQGGDVEVCIFYGATGIKFPSGVYKVTVIIDGNQVAEGEFALR